MNEIIEACKTIYNLKPVLDYKTTVKGNIFHGPINQKYIKHTTNILNLG